MAPIPQDAYRVLLTGFGPFGPFGVNPSWLAVEPLHGEVLTVDHNLYPSSDSGRSSHIHITTNRVPVTYKDVLGRVPGFHARPPYLPDDQDVPDIAPPEKGYDLVFHVGVAGRGPLRLERLGHKLGYNMKDANGELAPIVEQKPDQANTASEHEPSEAELLERQRILDTSTLAKGRVLRGFGENYDDFDDEIHTAIDVDALCKYIKQSDGGLYEKAYTSSDAGHYLCDFIYYCSLAESQRTAGPPLPPYVPVTEHKRVSRVFFLHCPPVDQPHSTAEVTEAIRRMIIWIISSQSSIS